MNINVPLFLEERRRLKETKWGESMFKLVNAVGRKMLYILPKHPHLDLLQWRIFCWSRSQASWVCTKVFKKTCSCYCNNFKYPVEMLKLLNSKTVWVHFLTSSDLWLPDPTIKHSWWPWVWGSAYSFCWTVLGSAEVANDAMKSNT